MLNAFEGDCQRDKGRYTYGPDENSGGYRTMTSSKSLKKLENFGRRGDETSGRDPGASRPVKTGYLSI
ncbi:hypothetical protein RB195_004232 [Necator americanus]|uniref:Uncharacterized protein n=1 Tax=Necator americanus TaxID=51031 RepID=A0ABR1BL46_NECAM